MAGGFYISHYGRKGMRWGKNIFGDDLIRTRQHTAQKTTYGEAKQRMANPTPSRPLASTSRKRIDPSWNKAVSASVPSDVYKRAKMAENAQRNREANAGVLERKKAEAEANKAALRARINAANTPSEGTKMAREYYSKLTPAQREQLATMNTASETDKSHAPITESRRAANEKYIEVLNKNGTIQATMNTYLIQAKDKAEAQRNIARYGELYKKYASNPAAASDSEREELSKLFHTITNGNYSMTYGRDGLVIMKGVDDLSTRALEKKANKLLAEALRAKGAPMTRK